MRFCNSAPAPPTPPRPTFCIYDSEEEREEGRRNEKTPIRLSPFPLLDSFETWSQIEPNSNVFKDSHCISPTKAPVLFLLHAYFSPFKIVISSALFDHKSGLPHPPLPHVPPLSSPSSCSWSLPSLPPVHPRRRHLDHGGVKKS